VLMAFYTVELVFDDEGFLIVQLDLEALNKGRMTSATECKQYGKEI
jgi:hypothetical protein